MEVTGFSGLYTDKSLLNLRELFTIQPSRSTPVLLKLSCVADRQPRAPPLSSFSAFCVLGWLPMYLAILANFYPSVHGSLQV